MIFNISNGTLDVDISTLGAELMSVKRGGAEYLWQGDKTYWGGRAYNLFPICGRLTEGKYVYRGKEYEMNLHGFLRKSELKAEKIADDKIIFTLESDERTLAMYPFRFVYSISYTLDNGKILIKISVTNKGDDKMYFALGGHHGFNVPLSSGNYDDYYLEFDKPCSPKSVDMSETCYTLHTEKDFPLKDGKILPLKHSLFDNDAIILRDTAHKVTLKSEISPEAVTVEFPEDMKYLGLWHAPKSEAPYISIEPWVSVPAYDGETDDLETKRDILTLNAGETYDLDWSISIE